MPGKSPQGTIEVGPLSLRAELGSVDVEARTAELIFSTGAAVERYDWSSGQRYMEKLAIDDKAVRLDRLNAAGPLLDSHSSYSISDQLGAVVPGTARIEKNRAVATVKFSSRDAVAPIFQDVRDGILRSVSVGYRVFKFVEEKGDTKIPVRTAVDWEPYEISMVSMPADTGAKVRREQIETNACVLITRQETAMDEDREQPVVEDRAVPADGGDVPEPNQRDLGMQQERERNLGIRAAVTNARLPQSVGDKLISEGISLLDARGKVLEMLGEIDRRGPATPAKGNSSAVQFGVDPIVHVRAGIENAIAHRAAPQLFKLSDEGRQYRGMSMMDIAKAFLTEVRINVNGLSKQEIAGVALGMHVRTGYHTTSDFANLLADVSNKMLRAAYDAAPQTFLPIARQVTLPDFKPANRVQIGEAPALLLVDEHGEFKRGTIGEAKEVFQLGTYGRVFAITRKVLVNDDTDAFGRVATMFGRSARNLESDLVWKQFTTNPTMGDGTALFATGHGNLSGTSDAISETAIGAARAGMRLQTGLDGVTLLNITPKYIIVPAAKETLADKFVSPTLMAALSTNINPFAGKLQVIAEPRLDANSTTAWYITADPSQIDIVEFAYLEGENGPTVESRVGFDIDGLEIKARHDFAAKVIDWRGVYKNPGA